MIVELNGFICQGNIGTKAKSIVDLNRNGFKVPTSVALDTSEYIEATKDIKPKINLLIERLKFDNIEIISKQIRMLFENVMLSDSTCLEIFKFIHSDSNYILRVSIDGVDENYSYAGLFPIKRGINKANIIENIIECYKSLYSYNSLYYYFKNNIDISSLAPAIIIQKEIETDILGYVNTMNPVTLDNFEYTISIKKNNIVEEYKYNYMSDNFVKEDSYGIVTEKQILDTIELIKNVQTTIGFPIEIELAYTRNNIYIIQTREITNILYDNKNSIWRRKKLCTKKFIYSLVEDNYNEVIKEYYDSFKIKDESEPVSLEFNSCYYNVLNISNIIDSVVEYDNNYFYSNLDIENPIERKNNLKSKYKRFKNKKVFNNKIEYYLEEYENISEKYHQKYIDYCSLMTKISAKDIEKIWLKLVFDDYNELYKTYTDLKILVLIFKNKLYKQFMPYIDSNEFNEIIHVKENTVKYKINKKYNELINKIKNDEEAYRYWFSSSTLKILKNYNEDFNAYYHDEFRKFIDEYGYLSFFKFDLSESFYVEDVEDVIRDIKKQLANFELVMDNEMARNEVLKKLKDNTMENTYDKLIDDLTDLQNLIIDLSDLKDIVSRFNFIVKRFSKTLAKLYLKKGILEKESDIWYVDINTIYDFTEGEIDGNFMKNIVDRNKLYYKAYRNYVSKDNIGYIHKEIENYNYKGIGCSTDIVKGRVRKIKSLKELSTLTHSDIFVTKTININLLFQLPIIRGIIISDNNISNSVKTIIREMKIPCVILEGSGKKLDEDSLIIMDAGNGKIKKVKK